MIGSTYINEPVAFPNGTSAFSQTHAGAPPVGRSSIRVAVCAMWRDSSTVSPYALIRSRVVSRPTSKVVCAGERPASARRSVTVRMPSYDRREHLDRRRQHVAGRVIRELPLGDVAVAIDDDRIGPALLALLAVTHRRRVEAHTEPRAGGAAERERRVPRARIEVNLNVDEERVRPAPPPRRRRRRRTARAAAVLKYTRTSPSTPSRRTEQPAGRRRWRPSPRQSWCASRRMRAGAPRSGSRRTTAPARRRTWRRRRRTRSRRRRRPCGCGWRRGTRGGRSRARRTAT